MYNLEMHHGCPVCNKGFPEKNQLKRHVQSKRRCGPTTLTSEQLVEKIENDQYMKYNDEARKVVEQGLSSVIYNDNSDVTVNNTVNTTTNTHNRIVNNFYRVGDAPCPSYEVLIFLANERMFANNTKAIPGISADLSKLTQEDRDALTYPNLGGASF